MKSITQNILVTAGSTTDIQAGYLLNTHPTEQTVHQQAQFHFRVQGVSKDILPGFTSTVGCDVKLLHACSNDTLRKGQICCTACY